MNVLGTHKEQTRNAMFSFNYIHMYIKNTKKIKVFERLLYPKNNTDYIYVICTRKNWFYDTASGIERNHLKFWYGNLFFKISAVPIFSHFSSVFLSLPKTE